MSPRDPEERARRRARKRARKDVAKLVGVMLFFLAAGWFLKSHIAGIREMLSPDGDNRLASQLVFAAFGSLLVSMGIPRIWLCGLAGGFYGAVEGSVIGLAASVAGSLGPYVLGRTLLSKVVRRRFGQRVSRWADRFAAHPFRYTLTVRLLPATNATVSSLLCGACKVGIVPYVAATTVGYLPTTIALAVTGSAAVKQSGFQIVLAALLILLSIGAPMLLKRGRKEEAEDAADAAADARR